MGIRVYRADNGNIYGSKAEAIADENSFNLRKAMSEAGFDVPDDFSINREQADAILSAVKPFSTPKSYPNRKPRSANGASKGSRAAKESSATAA